MWTEYMASDITNIVIIIIIIITSARRYYDPSCLLVGWICLLCVSSFVNMCIGQISRLEIRGSSGPPVGNGISRIEWSHFISLKQMLFVFSYVGPTDHCYAVCT